MPLLFSSLFTVGSGLLSPGISPDAGFAWTDSLLYHFRSTSDLFSDLAGTMPAHANDPVARWGNQGSSEDAVQTTAARRPILRSGGLNGLPYLECEHALQQFFEDLAFSQPSSTSNINPFTVFVVTDVVSPDDFYAILGSPATNGGKVALYFRPQAGQQIHFVKSQVRVGDVANPQIIMATVGRNAAGTTSSPHTRLWVRQNGANLWDADSQTSSLTSTAITSTQFLRNSGLSNNGHLDGRLYEFLLYEGTLDNDTTFAVEGFLASKYGIGLG
jgi:hypothetical protein